MPSAVPSRAEASPERTGEGPQPLPAAGKDARCRRCLKPIVDFESEAYYLQTGLCFWCAYVDSQG